jgi:rare lipoprotein A
MKGLSRLAILLLGLMVAGCAETTLVVDQTKRINGENQVAPYKVGNPYQIDGVWYYPAVNYDYDETGVASWYGPGFVGHSTANGEVYDANALTAAHKTLPMPTLVRVTNLENGRQIQIRINDRGPYVNNRIIDLSQRAAQLLGMEQQGTAKVRVQVMADESRQLALASGAGQDAVAPKPVAAPAPKVTTEALPGSTAPAPASTAPAKPIVVAAIPVPQPSPVVVQEPVHPTNMFIQAGAFLQLQNADRLRARLSGVGAARVVPVQLGAQRFYRVRLGPIATVQQADAMLSQVIAMGNKDARLVVE